VGHLWSTVAVAVGLFTGTNIDDLILLTVLFLSARAQSTAHEHSRPALWQIVAGQYVGIGTLIAISAAAALGLAAVPEKWVRLAGLVPLSLGVYGLIKALHGWHRARGSDDPARPVRAVPTSALGVAAVTIANGTDNISTYTPAFRTVGLGGSLVMIAVFTVLAGVWCVAASWLGSHRRVIATVERFGHWLVPAVFITVGTLILLGA
jgi:cadmium resistance protein CadD (predicted permease)